MDVSFDMGKIIKCAIYKTVFFPSGVSVDEVVVNETNYQGCQFDMHFIQYQISTDNLRIMNEFVQYVQNYFQYVYIPI